MPDETPIADCLVLVLPQGATLAAWQRAGTLGREWAMPGALGARYPAMIVASTGDESEQAALDAVTPHDRRARTRVALLSLALLTAAADGNDAALGPVLLGAIRGAIGRGVRTAVVRTHQLIRSEHAGSIARALRGAGLRTAMVARGGHIWSRFVAHEQGPESLQAFEAGRREGLLCADADMVVGSTARMVEDLAWRYQLNPLRTSVAPNCIVMDAPVVGAPGADSGAGAVASGDDEPQREEGLVLYKGELLRRKRVHVLIEAIALVAKANPAARFEVVGDGPERQGLEELARSLSAPVTFLGVLPHTEVLARMRACQIFASASELEGHPQTILEAMACGAAVLVSETPGLSGAVHHGVTGLKCDGQPESFAHVMQELLQDSDWRSVLGASAARMTRERYDLPVVRDLELDAHRRAMALVQGTELRRAG
jgi:glycosyltransferase involved in cell wall biosynthesis